MLQANFLISFDCEGKWGVADWVADRENDFFNNDRLNQAYQKIIQLLSHHDIKATFAFVGAFTLSETEYHDKKERLFPNSGNAPADIWVSKFKRDAALGMLDGWLNPEALNIVSAHPEHEIAAHGFTHTPLEKSWISLARFTHEMECLKTLPVFQKDNLTFVYPRNLIGYHDQLKQYGFIAYREALQPDRTTLKGRMLNLIDEINIFRTSQAHSEQRELIQIPAGFVLNWRARIRKKIPFNITLMRWEHLLNHALAHKKVFHLWAHPHNFVSGDRMFDLLDGILQNVSHAQKSGKIANVTQEEYARQFQRLN